MIELKRIKEMEDFKKLIEIQRSAWGFLDLDIEPHHVMTRVQKYGGLVQGLYYNGQDKGFGFLLKKAQRDEVQRMGYQVMRWNFDPLESMNAFFNIHRLGIISVEYERDIYGTGESGLHKGLPTDRLIATWKLDSDRVEKKMEQKDPSILEDIPRENLDNFTQDTAYIEIPKNIRALKETRFSEAVEWRMKTRHLFESSFQKGYVVEDFVFSKDKQRVFYKLYHREARVS